jgi:hypothetical protein
MQEGGAKGEAEMAADGFVVTVAVLTVASLLELVRRHAVGARFVRLQRMAPR